MQACKVRNFVFNVNEALYSTLKRQNVLLTQDLRAECDRSCESGIGFRANTALVSTVKLLRERPPASGDKSVIVASNLKAMLCSDDALIRNFDR